MKKFFLAKAGIFALAAGIILPSTTAHGETFPSSVSAATESININEVSNETPVIDIYDKDKNLIKTYTKGELEKLNQNLAPLSYKSFGPAKFSSYKWINGGTSFYRPKSVNAEANGKVCGLKIEVNQDGTPLGEAGARGCFQGGLNIPISHITDYYGNYFSLKLVNRGGGTISLAGGQVYY